MIYMADTMSANARLRSRDKRCTLSDGVVRSVMRWTKPMAWLQVMLAGLCVIAGPVHAAGEEARVLILNALDPYLPAYQAIDSAMRAGLAAEGTRRIVLYSEQLDAQRFAAEPLEPEVLALLTKKYRTLRFDVVVTVTKPAFDFFMRYGEQLWPGARLVFNGLPDPRDEPPTAPPNAVGLVNPDDLGATLDLARRLQPDARRLLVIAGVSPLDMELERRVRQEVPAKAAGMAVEFLSGLPLPELVTRVAAEPPDTIVFYLSQFRDRDGRPYLPRELLRTISNASLAPIYGFSETYVGFGVVAGSMEFYSDRGKLVAQLVRGVIAGKAPAPGHAISSVPSRCVADARELARWSLDERRLPDGCDVRFAERPPWRQYWWQIAVGLAILIGQTALIAALFVQRQHRRIAEGESQARLSEMAHMNRRVAMGGLAASIAHELNQPLGAINNNAGAAKILIKSEPPRLDEVAEILDDIQADDRRASEVIARIRKMLRKVEVEVEDVDLNETINDTLKLLAHDAKRRGVSLQAELAPNLSKVRADPVQVQQVILNLALNAMEAMHDQPAAHRKVIIRSARANDSEAQVSVADSGIGIAAELLPRIFSSFVTTKPTGMGLGLSISRAIVENLGGRMRAENLPVGGAAFHFTLPFVPARQA